MVAVAVTRRIATARAKMSPALRRLIRDGKAAAVVTAVLKSKRSGKPEPILCGDRNALLG